MCYRILCLLCACVSPFGCQSPPITNLTDKILELPQLEPVSPLTRGSRQAEGDMDAFLKAVTWDLDLRQPTQFARARQARIMFLDIKRSTSGLGVCSRALGFIGYTMHYHPMQYILTYIHTCLAFQRGCSSAFLDTKSLCVQNSGHVFIYLYTSEDVKIHPGHANSTLR